MISPESSITLPLKSGNEGDYLHISIVSGPGRLEGICVVNMPSWIDFDLSYAGDTNITHSGNRTLLKIQPGPPIWQIKMTQSLSSLCARFSDRIAIIDS
ncbi:MAG: hypothetical protein ACM3SY_07210 [Candidatus Omnitrophota bacterium]